MLMVKFNKFILIGLLLLVIASFSAVSAADNVNLTDDLITHSTSDFNDNLRADDVIDMESPDDSRGILKEESKSIVITNKTFSNYFDSEGRILDSVADGSTLDFQGSIEASDNIKAIYINKSVNIISTTKDGTITLNSVNGTLGMENIANRFIITNASSIIIRDVVFNRTQMFICDSGNVILDNVSIILDNYSVLSKDDILRMHEETPIVIFGNITCFTFKNSLVHVYNIGSAVINCSEIKEALFDNNRFYGYADSYIYLQRCMDMIYFQDYDASVNITNNKVYANRNVESFASVSARSILFENNAIEQPDAYGESSSVRVGLAGNDDYNTIVRNNNLQHLSTTGAIITNNNVVYAAYCKKSLMYNNTIGGMSNLGRTEDSIIYNNTIYGNVIIKGNNVILKDSKVVGGIYCKVDLRNITIENNDINGEISIQSTETYINNNVINGDIEITTYSSTRYGSCEIVNNTINGAITIESKSSIVRNNIIYALSNDYAVTIKDNKNYILNEISGNRIYSRLYCGDDAVSYRSDYRNYIEDNSPKTRIAMSVNSAFDAFDYGGNTTIFAYLGNAEGNVTFDFDGEKYVVELVNGTASLFLSKYVLGSNNVGVIYEDSENDVFGYNYTSFTVNKVAYCPVELIYGNFYEGEVSSVDFVLPDDANGNISITLTNGIYTIDIEEVANGSDNIIALPGLFEGDYNVTASFSSIKYVTNSSDVAICVIHRPVYNLTANDIVMDYKDGSKYKVLVTKDGDAVVGEVVKITFNGKTVEVKTGSDGYATLTLDAAPKTYTIKAEYNGVTKSTKVTIKSILKASNISKKKAKNIKFSATLKNSKGKAITGKKITFKFKGKTYVAKTNKKGVATITLKNLKVGKYTITSKYGACTVKNTIKIKK